jgi:hypothetical protein
MKPLRRVLNTALIVSVVAVAIAVDRRDSAPSEGATVAIARFAGFPHLAAGGRISTSWFCPGAAAGDGIESASVVIANPGDIEIVASINFLSDKETENETVTVPARSQLKVDSLRGRTIGVLVPIVEIIGSVGSVEQELIYAAGDVTSQCVSQTSQKWYFADGFTSEGSTQRLVLTNPFPESAVVNVAYTTNAGRRTPPVFQGLILAPRSARSISLADAGATDEARIAVEVTAISGQIVASRMQHYLGGGRLGYSTSLGVPATMSDWWFTSGRTGDLVTEELIVFNPSDTSAQVNVTFFGVGITNDIPIDQSSPAAFPSSTIDIPAGGIVAINTDGIADLPRGDHAMVVSSLNKSRLVVEHVLSQRTGGSTFTAVTNGIPGGLASVKWRIPSGLAKGARSALTILNSTSVDGTFTVSTMGPGGLVALPSLTDVPLGSAALIGLDVPEGVTSGEVVVTASVPIVVQRRTSRGHGLVGFGIVGALPVVQRQ